MNDGRREKSLVLNKLREKFNDLLPDEDELDPWNLKEEKKVSDEEIEQAIENMSKPKKKPPYFALFLQLFTLAWGIGHFAILYVMIGSPISGGILVYVLISLLLYAHYFMLLNKERKQR
jgi:hypothetical protein